MYTREINRAAEEFLGTVARDEPHLRISVERIHPEDRPVVLTKKCGAGSVGLLLAIPHGVESMNNSIAGLVQTSNNLATAAMGKNAFVVETMARSSHRNEQDAVERKVAETALAFGAEVATSGRYPGWQPVTSSKLLTRAQEAYATVTGTLPEVKAVHAGLECGIIGEHYPGMEMISIGPTITGAHSPDERVDLSSVNAFWKVLLKLLQDLS